MCKSKFTPVRVLLYIIIITHITFVTFYLRVCHYKCLNNIVWYSEHCLGQKVFYTFNIFIKRNEF